MVCASPRLHALHITIRDHEYQIFGPERILWRKISHAYKGGGGGGGGGPETND
jgi:hypothetical protein